MDSGEERKREHGDDIGTSWSVVLLKEEQKLGRWSREGVCWLLVDVTAPFENAPVKRGEMDEEEERIYYNYWIATS